MRWILLLPLALVASCGAPTTEMGAAVETVPADFPLLEQVWRVRAVGPQPAGDSIAALRFEADGSLVGSTGVNRLSGTYSTNGTSALAIGPLVTTRVSGSPEAMAFEAALLEGLGRVDGFRLRGETLLLLAEGQPAVRAGFGEPGDLE